MSEEEDASDNGLVYLLFPQFLALCLPYDMRSGLYELRPAVNNEGKQGRGVVRLLCPHHTQWLALRESPKRHCMLCPPPKRSLSASLLPLSYFFCMPGYGFWDDDDIIKATKRTEFRVEWMRAYASASYQVSPTP